MSVKCRMRHSVGVWHCEFTFDRTPSGNPLTWLSIVDQFTRVCLVLEINRGITSDEVID